MSEVIQIRRWNIDNKNVIIFIPDLESKDRQLYSKNFHSHFSVREIELSTKSIRFDFPKTEEWIDQLSREILDSKRKVKLIGEGLWGGIVFELLKKYPQMIEAACILNPTLNQNEENWFPKNVEWILERFPWNLFSEGIYTFYQTLETKLQFGLTNSKLLPTIVFTKTSEKITKQIQTLQRFPVFRIESSNSKSIQNLLENLILKILKEVPISSVQKKSKFKIEPGF
ncbi:hypothetical protein [Leptospira kirschneri]|uniref:Alpha/beta hydrolase n=2 Tax=Leptospira kirschneri TaxID=29507 RepID=A0A1T1DPI1_9LEPT|nr:hypothetical protein [Leptospira kirschneri]EMO76578.1 hypothetical protein LEP1GSC127_2501 [Leptospira kirschneri str. 200801925]EJO70833.1 hypothetical protein LEP1GSC044_2024 [Leptospira kirschneri serovar Grippotyphosa str. RM52]EKO51650.1 hypothetical protein LEP1GSC131_2607 [Leptospira kirschneri str. 200802841]EKQ84215.1 hypothetical protein LEP1GSC064_0464 [Leptospira kirschneri serovar Grippotyphosa str. Moskva]EKR10110.1 hypothetical protein LEP1GSC122_3488 [Leptospira kirschneri 